MTLAALSPRKRKYVQARRKGFSKAVAARKAGYAESVALNAQARIETPDVKAVMLALAQRELPPERLATELRSGIDAKTPRLISWGDKLRYLQTAAEWAGYVERNASTSTNLHILAALPSVAASPIDISIAEGERQLSPVNIPPVEPSLPSVPDVSSSAPEA